MRMMVSRWQTLGWEEGARAVGQGWWQVQRSGQQHQSTPCESSHLGSCGLAAASTSGHRSLKGALYLALQRP